MGKVERLRSVESDLSFPARKVLEDLLEQHQKAQASQNDALVTLSRAMQIVREAETRKEDAENSLGRAKKAHVAHLAGGASSGELLVPFRPLQAARAEAIEAQDNLDAIKAALAVLQATANRAVEETRKLEVAIRNAAKDVIAVEARRLMLEAKSIQQKLIERRAALRAITVDLGIDGGPIADELKRFLDDRALPGGFGSVEYRDWSTHPSALQWKQAFGRLLLDPNTPLPR